MEVPVLGAVVWCGVVRLFWPADSWSAYRLCCRCQAAGIKRWCGGVCSAMLSPAPSDLTHRVNLNRFETGSGPASLVRAHAGWNSVGFFTHCCCWACWSSIKKLSVCSLNLPLCPQLTLWPDRFSQVVICYHGRSQLMWFKELNTGGASLQVPAWKHVLNSKSLRTRRLLCEDVLVESLAFN